MIDLTNLENQIPEKLQNLTMDQILAMLGNPTNYTLREHIALAQVLQKLSGAMNELTATPDSRFDKIQKEIAKLRSRIKQLEDAREDDFKVQRIISFIERHNEYGGNEYV